jgi:hypothetical protein
VEHIDDAAEVGLATIPPRIVSKIKPACKLLQSESAYLAVWQRFLQFA